MTCHLIPSIKKALLALVVVALVGCATTGNAPDPLKSPPKEGESAVTISITSNTAQVDGFNSISLTRIAPVINDRTTTHVLTRVAPELSRDTSLFIGVLPEGEYEFTTLSSTQKFLPLNESMRRRIGSFTVKSGKPVDLGRLVLTPVNTKVIVGRSALVTSNLPLMKRFSPEYAKLFTENTYSGWKSPRADNDRTEEYALLRPVGADFPVALPDGHVVAASRLGSVLVRSPSGVWDTIRSNGLESLLFVAPVNQPDATLIAAGEFGTLLKQSPGSSTLTPIDTGNLPPGNLLFIDGNETDGWYIAQQNGKQVTLFHSKKLASGQWQSLRTETIGMNFWNGINSFWIWHTKRGLGYAISEGSINFLDYASGTWITRKAPNNNRLSAIKISPNNTIGILTSPGGGFGGIFASTYLSRDDGQTWQEIKAPFNVKISPPYELLDGTLLMAGGVFSNPELQASKDQGQTWQHLSDFKLDRTLTPLRSGGLVSVDLGQLGLFSIQYSSDGGTTWKTEYSNFDRYAYDIEQERKKK